MFRYFKNIDGYQIVIKTDAIIAVQDLGYHRLILTPFDEFEVQETLEEIFSNKATFSNN